MHGYYTLSWKRGLACTRWSRPRFLALRWISNQIPLLSFLYLLLFSLSLSFFLLLLSFFFFFLLSVSTTAGQFGQSRPDVWSWRKGSEPLADFNRAGSTAELDTLIGKIWFDASRTRIIQLHWNESWPGLGFDSCNLLLGERGDASFRWCGDYRWNFWVTRVGG